MDPVAQGQLALAQNMGAVLTGNNQVFLEEKDLTALAMRQLMKEVRGIISIQASEITTLKARIVQLEADKRNVVDVHTTEIASLKSLLATNHEAVKEQIVKVDAKHKALEKKYNNHKHIVSKGPPIIPKGKTTYCCSTAKALDDAIAEHKARQAKLNVKKK